MQTQHLFEPDIYLEPCIESGRCGRDIKFYGRFATDRLWWTHIKFYGIRFANDRLWWTHISLIHLVLKNGDYIS